ncbi:hypothetical protein QYF61_027177, partial [Mycteria americana]
MHQFLWEEAVGNCIKSLGEIQVDNVHRSPHINRGGYFVVENDQTLLVDGVMLAFFQSSGTSPDLHHFSKIMESGLAMTSAGSLNTLGSVTVAYCKIPLGDDPSDLDPEAFNRASTITIVDFYTFKVLLNIERDSSSSSSLPVFMKQSIAIHHNPPVMTFIYPFFTRGRPFPLQLLFFGTLFCIYNGFLQGYYLIYCAEYPNDWCTDIRFTSGLLLFLLGMGINIHSDLLLRQLRKPGEVIYKIPQGGLFTYVSGANYFGEIVEWFGFAIATWSLPAFAFAFFTLCCIGPRAYHHH